MLRTQLELIKKEYEIIQENLRYWNDHRAALRRDYVDRDREIGNEIKHLTNRLKELEEKVSKGEAAAIDEIASGAELANQTYVDAESQQKGEINRRPRQNMKLDVVPKIVGLMREHGGQMAAKDIFRLLAKRYGMIFSNPTVTMKKVVELEPQIIKIDKGMYELENNGQ